MNISISDEYWIGQLYNQILPADFAVAKPNGQKVMVEYSSPNTNKPLHLGHIRNNLLGYSVAQILGAAGYEVVKANLVNDRGIHICKSMLAWQMFGNGETPESSGLKGDHLVGKYYVLFDKELRKQVAPILDSIFINGDLSVFKDAQKVKIQEHLSQIEKLKAKQQGLPDDKEKQRDELADKIEEEEGKVKEIAKNATSLMVETQQMLQKWEAGDAEVIDLWKTMNGWVYTGFAETYKALGVDFDKYYYESNTYLLGKDIIEEGLAKDVFFKKPDGSVWIDLTSDGLDEKLVTCVQTAHRLYHPGSGDRPIKI